MTTGEKVFVSHASEDATLAEQVATQLTAGGVPAWFDGWEIRAGDSIRQKVDAGLAECRALLVLLSHRSVAKPWVQSEIDAGFVKRLDDSSVKLLFVLVDDDVPLTPLIRTLRYVTLSNGGVPGVVREVQLALTNASVAPPPGKLPDYLSEKLPGLDGAAPAVLRGLLRATVNFCDAVPVDRLAEDNAIVPDVMNDAVEQLIDGGHVTAQDVFGGAPYAHGWIAATARAYADFASEIFGWSAEEDVQAVAQFLASDSQGHSGEEIASALHITPLRIGVAVNLLLEEDAATVLTAIGTGPYQFMTARANHRTRRRARQ